MNTPWSLDLADDHCATLRIGALELWIQRRALDWRLAWRYGTDRSEQPVWTEGEPNETDPPFEGQQRRILTRRTQGPLELTVRTADRAVVVRPVTPVRIASGDQTVLFLTTPLWLRLEAPGLADAMVELPTTLLADTWLGSTTQPGGLHYSVLSTTQLILEEIGLSRSRVITRLDIWNRSTRPLDLERLVAPLPALPVYRDERRVHWTSPVQLQRQADWGEPRILDGAPIEAGPCERVAERRRALEPAYRKLLGELLR